jgi:hypothetical protein
MARRELNAHDLAMKNLAASITWFLAAWVIYDMSAYVLGMPRQMTPVVALAIAIAMGVWLHGRRATGRLGKRQPSMADPQLQNAA